MKTHHITYANTLTLKSNIMSHSAPIANLPPIRLPIVITT